MQVSSSVACNRLHTIEKRCSRWLLMTHDRGGPAILPLTHEFLGIMLVVRRASVRDVLKPIQTRGLINSATRNSIGCPVDAPDRSHSARIRMSIRCLIDQLSAE